MDAAAPTVSCLICATPRSGSTLLCETLIRTGVAGRPREYFEALPETGLPRQPREYFPPGARLGVELPPVRSGPPLPSFAERLAAARAQGTTPNGVFAAKVMWGYLQPILDGLGAPPEEALPGLHYVLVRRRDKLRQAVSLWRAIQSQEWSREGDAAHGRHELVYSRRAIGLLHEQLGRQESAWQEWLTARDARPLVLDYEDFAERPDEAAAAVIDHLGVAPPRELPPPQLRRQSDALTEEWVRRQLEDAA